MRISRRWQGRWYCVPHSRVKSESFWDVVEALDDMLPPLEVKRFVSDYDRGGLPDFYHPA